MEKLTELIRRLYESGAEFSVIGGLAAVQHGSSYVTFDLDICARFSPQNLRKIESTIRDLHPRWRIKDVPFELEDELIKTLKNVYLQTDWGKFDCLSEVQAIGDFDAVLKESSLMQYPFGRCYVLNLPALIRAKESIGRPQDMLVVTQLRAIQEKNERK